MTNLISALPNLEQRVAELNKGDKVAPIINSQIEAIMLSNELEKLGYKTRIAQHPETRRWTVAIINERNDVNGR